MALTTKSQFFYGHVVDSTNFNIDFDEGSGEITATLNIGGYSFEDYATEIARAMTAISSTSGVGQEYTVTTDRSDRTLTISAAAGFDLLVSSGTNIGTGAFTLMGFTGADTGSATSHTSNTTSGSVFRPQFKIQSFVDPENNQKANDASVNESTSGDLEIVKFGSRKFLETEIIFQTDLAQPAGGPIENDSSGVANARSFMEAIVERNPIEFMQDRATPNSFITVILESTPESNRGTDFKLKEQFNRGLPGYYNIGLLVFRKVE